MASVKVCPVCETDNEPGASNCINCGGMVASVRLTAANAVPPPTLQVTPTVVKTSAASSCVGQGITCTDTTCGVINPPGQERCIVCNGKLSLAIEPMQAPSPVTTRTNNHNVPFKIAGTNYNSISSIIKCYTFEWDTGIKDIHSGRLQAWVKESLEKDDTIFHNKFNKIVTTNDSSEIKLFLLIASFLPDSPPIWRGVPLDSDNLNNIAKIAITGNTKAIAQITEIVEKDLLIKFSDVTGDAETKRNGQAISAAVEAYNEAWKKAVSINGFPIELINSAQTETTSALIVLSALSESFATDLRREVVDSSHPDVMLCPWFCPLGKPAKALPSQLIVQRIFLEQANAWAKKNVATKNIKRIATMKTIAASLVILSGVSIFLVIFFGHDTKMSNTLASVMISAKQTKQIAEIIGKTANIRLEPSKNSRIIAKAGVGNKFEVLTLQDKWLKVGNSGKEMGWVSRDAVNVITTK